MSLSRRPLRVALVCAAAVVSVGAGVGIATGAPSTPGEVVVGTPAGQHVPGASDATEEGGDGYEGPGTDVRPAPVYGSASPSSWTIAVPTATVYAVPGDTDTKTGTIADRSADVAGTGRTATVGQTEWFEVKVPGATTGWVVGTELTRR